MKPNSLMLAGAICGFLIWGGFTGLQETYRHKGPGVVSYSYGRPNPWSGGDADFDVTVSEADYKRDHYVGYAFLLALGIYGWIGILRAEAKMAKKGRLFRSRLFNFSTTEGGPGSCVPYTSPHLSRNTPHARGSDLWRAGVLVRFVVINL